MSTLLDFIRTGGVSVIAIVALSVILYERCGSLLFFIWRARRRLGPGVTAAREELPQLRRLQDELQESFQRQKTTIGAMIKAAPLLGLLGTVMGMSHTFDHLALQQGQKSMEGLTGGISEALLSTEAGLGVAIPAILILYFAQRQLQKTVHRLFQIEAEAIEAG